MGVGNSKEESSFPSRSSSPSLSFPFSPSPSFVSTGKDIVFVTNNATKSRRQYKAKFDKLGIQASEVRPFLQEDDERREFEKEEVGGLNVGSFSFLFFCRRRSLDQPTLQQSTFLRSSSSPRTRRSL